jgi:hypothetical protein
MLACVCVVCSFLGGQDKSEGEGVYDMNMVWFGASHRQVLRSARLLVVEERRRNIELSLPRGRAAELRSLLNSRAISSVIL